MGLLVAREKQEEEEEDRPVLVAGVQVATALEVVEEPAALGG
jgi:hypothetical protein